MLHRLHEEIQRVVPDNRDVAYDDLANMRYLDCVVKETQRYYMVAGATIYRIFDEDIQLGDTTIPKGVCAPPFRCIVADADCSSA